MSNQTNINYYEMFSGLVKRYNELAQRRTEIDRELTKLNQIILATFPLLPEDKQKLFQTEIEAMEERSGGLLDAIKLVFSAHIDEWMTASQVRNYLSEMGFDLTQYTANPLASIATTLRRMAGGRIESKVDGNQTMYRRRMTMLEKLGREKFDAERIGDKRMKALYESGMRGNEKPKK